MKTQDILHSLLRYDANSGKLFWRERPAALFKRAGYAARWNAKYADKEAMAAKTAQGYGNGPIMGETLLAHRVVWAMHHGDIPPGMFIDHIDGDRTNNRLCNLRIVSPKVSMENTAKRGGCTSPHIGVSYATQLGKWIVRIRNKHRGVFSTEAEAARAAKDIYKLEGFHPNHGRDYA